MTNVAVIAMQGAFARHVEVLTELGVKARPVRDPEELAGASACVLPGGESTTIAKLLRRSGLREPLGEMLRSGTPVLGTCAGAILLAREIANPAANDDEPLGIVDVAVRRNAFGRQLDSFEADIDVTGLATPFHGVFIRAPWFEDRGVGVDVLAWQNDRAVMVRQETALLCAFHPELAGDRRVHEIFMEMLV